LLTVRGYGDFSLTYIERVIGEVLRRCERPVPVIVYTKGGGQWLERIADCGCDAVGLDWTTDVGDARRRVGRRVALQGNLDPQVLLATPDVVEREARAVLQAAGSDPGYIFNLGHGILPTTPPENVAALVACVKAHGHVQHGLPSAAGL
jgi:uroporphyrinogen decarboxylase